MDFLVAFTSPTLLPVRYNHGFAKRTALCTIAPERSTTPSPKGSNASKKKEKSKHYSVLPPDASKKNLSRPPIHRSVPMFGFLIEGMLGLGTTWSRAAEYGPVYESNFLMQQSVYVTKPGAIIDMSRDADTFRSSGAFDAFSLMFGNDNLIVLDGARHTASRSVIAGAFSPALFPFYFKAITRRVNRTWAQANKDVDANGRLLLDPVLREHYLSVAVEMTTGIDMDSDMAVDLRKNFLSIQRAFFSPPVGPVWGAGIRARDVIMVKLQDLVRDSLISKSHTIEKLREYGEKLSYLGGKDIVKGDVNVMLIAIANSDLKTGPDQENDPALIENIASLILLLWFAGYATSAATTACATLELGMNESLRNQLIAEQDEIVAASGGHTEVTYQQTSAMPLLDSFVSEILRMRPAASLLARKASKDVEIHGYYVPEGSIVLMDLSAAMRDPEMFDDPQTLRIDRFLKKEGQPPPPKILSFGAPGSPHYCIGGALARVLIKTTLATLLRDYDLKLDPSQSMKYSIVPEETPASKVVCIGLQKRK